MAKQIIGFVYRNVEGVANEEVVEVALSDCTKGPAESLRSKATKSLSRSLKEH